MSNISGTKYTAESGKVSGMTDDIGASNARQSEFMRNTPDNFGGPVDDGAVDMSQNNPNTWDRPDLASRLPKSDESGRLAADKQVCDCHRYERQVCDICQGVTGNETDVQPTEQKPKVGDLFYDGMGYIFLQTEHGPTMFAEMRGVGASLPIGDNARKLCAAWNAAKGTRK